MPNPTLLYLPLLTHQLADVRVQACRILLESHGQRSLTYLRRLLDDPDLAIATQAKQALAVVGEISGLSVDPRPFRGVYLQCLGQFEVFFDGRQIQPNDWDGGGIRAGGRKVQALFAFLADRGRSGATRAEIAEALWGGAVSAVSISRTISALRAVLAMIGGPERAAELFNSGRGRISFHPNAYHSDADLFARTFDRAADCEASEGLEAAALLYQQAIDLYTGSYMLGVQSPTDWAEERRDYLAGVMVIATERLAEQSYEQQQYRRCREYCLRGFQVDPNDESLIGWMLRSCMHLGLTHEFAAVYRRYSQSLEHGQLPATEIEAIVQAAQRRGRTPQGLASHATPH